MQLAKKFDDSHAVAVTAQPVDGNPPARVKTRLLHRGYPGKKDGDDIFDQKKQPTNAEINSSRGEVTVIGGPERGRSYNLTEQYLRIGRSKSQEIQLLNDDAVSRESHAVIGFVPDSRRFIIIDGGKVNPVLVNGAVVHDAAFLGDGDVIKIGESTLYLTVY